MTAKTTKKAPAKKKAQSKVGKNVYERIYNVQQGIKTVLKSGYNDFNKYAYATERDIVAEVKPLLKEQRLVIVQTGKELKNEQHEQNEKNYRTFIKLHFKIVNVDNPDDFYEADGYGEAKDEQDKGIPKAYTMALKYFLSKTFLVETGDDTERDEPKDTGNGKKGKAPTQQESTKTPEQHVAAIKQMVASSRNIDGLLEYAQNKLPNIKAFTAEQKKELNSLISQRVDELSQDQNDDQQKLV